MDPIDRLRYCKKQWLISKRSLENEFDIAFDQIQVKGQVKNLFFSYVQDNLFSHEACISLYYRLFFFATLLLVQILENEGIDVESLKLKELRPICQSSLKWAKKSSDQTKLESVLGNVNVALELLIHDFIDQSAS
jgi:hypothetical protein